MGPPGLALVCALVCRHRLAHRVAATATASDGLKTELFRAPYLSTEHGDKAVENRVGIGPKGYPAWV